MYPARYIKVYGLEKNPKPLLTSQEGNRFALLYYPWVYVSNLFADPTLACTLAHCSAKKV